MDTNMTEVQKNLMKSKDSSKDNENIKIISVNIL